MSEGMTPTAVMTPPPAPAVAPAHPPAVATVAAPGPVVADDPRFAPGAAAVVLWDHEANAGALDPATLLVSTPVTAWWRCRPVGHAFRARPLTALFRGCPDCRG